MKNLNSYKKIAKELIKEAAWDRKFGEPLPTLEDITKKYQEGKEDVNEKAFSSSIIAKAIKVAKSMGGNMTGAVKRIEKIKRNLSKDKNVANALRLANEETVSENADMVIHVDDKLQTNLVTKYATKFGLKSKKTKISWSIDY